MIRKLSDLVANAYMFWPPKIEELERGSSIIPKLIETQDKFISLLNVANVDPFAWKEALRTTKDLFPNLFLKHLMVLSDISGERLRRFKTELSRVFLDNIMDFRWEEKKYTYKFQTLSKKKTWDNKSLMVDGSGLVNNHKLSPAMEDVTNLILFGGSSLVDKLPKEIEEKCNIGTLIGRESELETFVKQRYIWVSRITGGAKANTLGNLVQSHAKDYLRKKLPKWDFTTKQVKGISHNERTPLMYDLVAKSPKGKVCAIEVCFQVTTNSVIERKAGQAQDRQKQLHERGHFISYIIDGAGNFERTSALRTLCEFSDCTVTLKNKELDMLVKFLLSLDE